MRKFAALVASGVLVAMVMAVAPSAGAHGGAHDDDLTVFAKATDFDMEDNGDEGVSEGDVLTLKADLFDEDGDEAGSSDSSCEVTRYEKGDDVEAHDHGEERHHENIEFSADCLANFDLDDGEINTSGEITEEDFDDGVMTFDIDGGTEDFEDAEGTVDIEMVKHGEEKTHDHQVSAMHAGHDHEDDKDDDDGDDTVFKVTFNFDN